MTKFAQYQSKTCLRMAHFFRTTHDANINYFSGWHIMFQNGTQHAYVKIRVWVCLPHTYWLRVRLFLAYQQPVLESSGTAMSQFVSFQDPVDACSALIAYSFALPVNGIIFLFNC